MNAYPGLEDSNSNINYAKEGQQFEVSNRFATVAANNGSVTIGFTTGSKPVVIKGRFISGLGVTELQYKAAHTAAYTGGIPIPVENLRVNGGVALTDIVINPTVTDQGIVYLRPYIILSAGNNAGSRIGTDFINKDTYLPSNTQCVFTITNPTNTAASPVFWYLTFVELDSWQY